MIAIAPTDHDWLENLTAELSPSVVNFWTPTPWNLTRLSEGDRFHFLLKAPYRKVAGYGDFLYYENMSAKEAWNRFGKGNGVKDFAELVARATKYATRHSVLFTPTHNPTIGCIVLENPIFLSEDEYFAPEDYGLSFPRQVVKVKYFDVENIEGCTTPLGQHSGFQLVEEESGAYRTSRAKNRQGQATFRQRVLAAYEFRCCITGESTVEVLDASHIQPYITRDSNHVQNGLSLRSDLHKLFDAGLITLDADYRIVISNFLDSEAYTSYQGQQIRLPHHPFYKPSKEALRAHRSLVFRA